MIQAQRWAAEDRSGRKSLLSYASFHVPPPYKYGQKWKFHKMFLDTHIFKKKIFLGQNVWPVAHLRTENTRKTPKNTFKKGHKMVKNQNFEKLLKKCLDIDLKIIFSKHYVPMPKTMYMRWKIRLFFLIHYKRENLVHAKKTNLYSINTCVSCFPNSSICPKYICHHK